jgi:hypothetical protein
MKAHDLKPIFSMFILISIGIAFILVIGNSISPSTQIQLLTNDSTSISGARLVGNQINNSYQFTLRYAQSVTGKTPISNFALINSSGSSISQAGNYSINSVTGVLNLTNSTYWVTGDGKNNQTYATYNYKSLNYVEDAGVRSTFDLIGFFAALGLLLGVIAYLNWDYLKEWFS